MHKNNIILSVALAIHNEEKNLDMCLSAIKDIADEIVIVDGESKDKSVDIAKKYKAKIIETSNKLNFHINKQMAIDACTGELILLLDADEVVDQDLFLFLKNLKNKVKKGNLNCVAWSIKRKNNFLGHFFKKGGLYPDEVIRIFIKGKAFLPQKDVHEQMKVKGKLCEALGHLLHYSYPDFKTYFRKFKTYTSFTANQLVKDKKVNFLNFLNFFFVKPIQTFFTIFVRNKGFIDGIYGFLFALFSSVFHIVAFSKALKIKYAKNKS